MTHFDRAWRSFAAFSVFLLLGAYFAQAAEDFGQGGSLSGSPRGGVSAGVGGRAHNEGGTSRWETRGEPRYIGRDALYPWNPRNEFLPSGDPHGVARGGTVNKFSTAQGSAAAAQDEASRAAAQAATGTCPGCKP